MLEDKFLLEVLLHFRHLPMSTTQRSLSLFLRYQLICIPLPSQSLTRLQPSQLQKYLRGAEFYLEKGPIQPEVWPTKEQFQMAITEFSTIQKSSTGISLFVETLELAHLRSSAPSVVWRGTVPRPLVLVWTNLPWWYPDPREELPYKRFVWYDYPAAGTLKSPSKYFNQQGPFLRYHNLDIFHGDYSLSMHPMPTDCI